MKLNHPNPFYIFETISSYTLRDFEKYLRLEKNPIIYIDCTGGDADATNAIIWLIKNCGKKVSVVVLGKAESAAVMIVKECHKRYAFKNSFFMFHLPRAEKNTFTVRKQMKKKLDFFINYYKKMFPKIKLYNKMSFYTAEEVKKMGIIDEII